MPGAGHLAPEDSERVGFAGPFFFDGTGVGLLARVTFLIGGPDPTSAVLHMDSLPIRWYLAPGTWHLIR
jgi:hypothetical protein